MYFEFYVIASIYNLLFIWPLHWLPMTASPYAGPAQCSVVDAVLGEDFLFFASQALYNWFNLVSRANVVVAGRDDECELAGSDLSSFTCADRIDNRWVGQPRARLESFLAWLFGWDFGVYVNFRDAVEDAEVMLAERKHLFLSAVLLGAPSIEYDWWDDAFLDEAQVLDWELVTSRMGQVFRGLSGRWYALMESDDAGVHVPTLRALLRSIQVVYKMYRTYLVGGCLAGGELLLCAPQIFEVINMAVLLFISLPLITLPFWVSLFFYSACIWFAWLPLFIYVHLLGFLVNAVLRFTLCCTGYAIGLLPRLLRALYRFAVRWYTGRRARREYCDRALILLLLGLPPEIVEKILEPDASDNHTWTANQRLAHILHLDMTLGRIEKQRC